MEKLKELLRNEKNQKTDRVIKAILERDAERKWQNKTLKIKESRIKEVLKIKHWKDFSRFMHGQTVYIGKNDIGISEDDFLKWIKKQEVID